MENPQTSAVEFVVWSSDGSVLSEEVVASFERAVNELVLAWGLGGHQLLTTTVRGEA